MIPDGLLIGIGTFLIIGALHPIVIKTEYHWGKNIWPVFLILGLSCIVGSLLADSVLLSALLAVLGFSLLWGIRELFEQEARVKKGWYPANPRRSHVQTKGKEK